MAKWSKNSNRKRSEALKGRKQSPAYVQKRVRARQLSRQGRKVYAYMFYRGHPTLCFVDEQIDPDYCSAWRYVDDLTKTPQDSENTGVERPCPACHRLSEPNGPDACLGWLPGVISACCGHGVEIPSVVLETGVQLTGYEALRWFQAHGAHPYCPLSESPAENQS
jgi:hypothetical protein